MQHISVRFKACKSIMMNVISMSGKMNVVCQLEHVILSQSPEQFSAIVNRLSESLLYRCQGRTCFTYSTNGFV